MVTSSLSTEEKKETIKSILSQVSEAYKAASEECNRIQTMTRRSKKRGELWKDIKQDDLAMRTIGDDDQEADRALEETPRVSVFAPFDM